MIDTIYIEEEILEHSNAIKIIEKVKPKNIVHCQSYKEIFNVKNQNFRIQKKKPSLILAKKNNTFLIKTPENFHIGGKKNYYFSHMYNCIFDCKYCYLQGMFSSANYVIFVNYDSYFQEIKKKLEKYPDEDIYFFSGYDCDSLALENITNFGNSFINFFKNFKKGFLELRTKNSQISSFLKIAPLDNIIFSWSLNPHKITTEFEDKTPSLEKRLESIIKMQKHSWNIGLRFDPIIYTNDFENIYKKFFEYIFKRLDLKRIHSITVGNFRIPKSYYKRFKKNTINSSYFLDSLLLENDKNTRHNVILRECRDFCIKKISNYFDVKKVYIN